MEGFKQTIKEADSVMKRSQRVEERAEQDALKYFDRIHDKLFAYQLFFLAAYISLIAIPKVSLSVWWIFIPLSCIVRLIWIDYKLMKYNQSLSQITEVNKKKRDENVQSIDKVNKASLEVILESAALTGVFLYFLASKI